MPDPKIERISLTDTYDLHYGFLTDAIIDPTQSRACIMGRPGIQETFDCGVFAPVGMPAVTNIVIDGSYTFVINYSGTAPAPYTNKSILYIAWIWRGLVSGSNYAQAISVYNLTLNVQVGSQYLGTIDFSQVNDLPKFNPDVTQFTLIKSVSLVSGGTGYTAGDILTPSGATPYPLNGLTITVNTVDGSGAILTFTASSGAIYSAFPTGNFSVTGGTGTGATFSAVTSITQGIMYQNVTPTIVDISHVLFDINSAGVVTFTSSTGPAGIELVSSITALNGYAWALSLNGYLFNSNVGDSSNWNSLDFTQAFDNFGTVPVSINTHQGYLIVFGNDQVRYFYVTGAINGSAAAPIQNLSFGIGAISSNTIDSVNEHLGFVGTGDGTGIPVYIMFPNSQVPQRVSYPYVEKLLSQNLIHTARFITFRGHLAFSVNTKAGISYIFDLTTKKWYAWNPFPLYSNATSQDYALDFPSVTGNITYLMGYAASNNHFYVMEFEDAGFDSGLTTGVLNYTPIVTTKVLDFGTMQEKTWGGISVVGDRTSFTSPVAISYSDDTGLTWISPGTVDLKDSYPNWRDMGESRRRMFRLGLTASPDVRVDGVEITFTVGTQ